jgi:hypothetical protein
MRIPGFDAANSLYASDVHYRAAGAPAGSRGSRAVLPQQSRFIGAPVDLQACWERCIFTPWNCPPECQGVPWPTIPPVPTRVVKY